jgi:hypothetical protein
MMIERLELAEFANVRKLFAHLRYHLMVDSIIEGNTPGWVFVDQVDDPTFGLMWNRQEDLQLAGDITADTVLAVREVVRGVIVPEARSLEIPQLVISYAPIAWGAEMDKILSGISFDYARRRFYNSSKVKYDWRSHIPTGLELQPIDEDLLKGGALERSSEIRACVRSFWHSIDHFLDTGFGFYLAQDREALSWCISQYASAGHFELGVYTPGEQRRRGYATLTAAACVERCIQHGWTAHWHSWEGDRASIAVAQKVGFEIAMGYQVVRVVL